MKIINIKELFSLSIIDLPGEIWEDVPGYVGRYEISNYSRVKSSIKRKSVILKRTLSFGRCKVALVDRYGRKKFFNPGRLAATCFLRPPLENEVLIYRDGNRMNDQSGNVYWATRQSVNKDTVKRAPRLSGERNGMALISSNDVKSIRANKEKGMTYKEISQKYKVSVPCIQKIVERRSWKNI